MSMLNDNDNIPLSFRSLVFSAFPSSKCVNSSGLKVHLLLSFSKSGFTEGADFAIVAVDSNTRQ